MRSALLIVSLAFLPACVTARLRENTDFYRWRLAGVDRPKTLVAGSVRLSADGMPQAVALRVVSEQGEIVDYREHATDPWRLSISERGFEAPTHLHATGNTPIVVLVKEGELDPEVEVGTAVLHAGEGGGELSAPSPLGEEEARFATIVVFDGKHLRVLAAPPGGRHEQEGRVSLLGDRGRTFELEPLRRGAWIRSDAALAAYYAALPFTLVIDAATLPFSVTGALLEKSGRDHEGPVVGHYWEGLKIWMPPPPRLPEPRKTERPTE